MSPGMGHVLFGHPTAEHFRLHERLARFLMERDHRVTFVTADQDVAGRYADQGFEVRSLVPGTAIPTHAPTAELAEMDYWLENGFAPTERQLARRATALTRLVGPLRRIVHADCPDLAIIHQGRGGLPRLVHFVAREAGCRVLHTGAGLLPHTMQWDERGLDGDATACHRSALDYRDVSRDPQLIAATTAAWLAGHAPLSAAAGEAAPSTAPDLPGSPFLAVLLQAHDCHRLRLDAPRDADPIELASATAEVARSSGSEVVVIAPGEHLEARHASRLREHGATVSPATSAAHVIAASAAVLTVNHPLGLGATLTGTPLIHLGRAPYNVPGVSVRTRLPELREAVERAIAVDNETLRERFLTRYLTEDVVWCSADQPDFNGLRGIVLRIEQLLRTDVPRPMVAPYRAGPLWPLQVR